MLASVFSPPAVRSKRTPATPTLVTGVTPGAYGRRDHSHQYYAYGRRVSNQRERQDLADQAALAPVVAVAPIAAHCRHEVAGARGRVVVARGLAGQGGAHQLMSTASTFIASSSTKSRYSSCRASPRT